MWRGGTKGQTMPRSTGFIAPGYQSTKPTVVQVQDSAGVWGSFKLATARAITENVTTLIEGKAYLKLAFDGSPLGYYGHPETAECIAFAMPGWSRLPDIDNTWIRPDTIEGRAARDAAVDAFERIDHHEYVVLREGTVEYAGGLFRKDPANPTKVYLGNARLRMKAAPAGRSLANLHADSDVEAIFAADEAESKARELLAKADALKLALSARQARKGEAVEA